MADFLVDHYLELTFAPVVAPSSDGADSFLSTPGRSPIRLVVLAGSSQAGVNYLLYICYKQCQPFVWKK